MGPEQTCPVKDRTIQNSLHLNRTILEGVKDDDHTAIINLEQLKALDRLDHRYLAAILQGSGFKADIYSWISLL